MGVSVDLHIYDAAKLKSRLKDVGARDDALTQKILEACGSFCGDSYVLLNNEYGDGYSPYYNVANLLDSAFDIEDSFDVFLDRDDTLQREGISYVDESEVADELGIKLKESD